MDISNELYEFISKFSDKRIRQQLNPKHLTKKTTLEELGIEDLDFDLFLTEFVEKFNINISKYRDNIYFGLGIPLIDNNVKSIKKVIGNAKWLPLEKEKRKPFTLGVLESALETGYLE